MRQLPANSNSGATGTTENSRSRSNFSSDSSSARALTNGTVKEPILTRSKTRLRGSRRLFERSPRKVTSPLSKHNDVESTTRRRPERRTGNSSSSSSSSSSPKNHASTTISSTHPEKMYARHYKSYRGLNGVKSRRGEEFSNDEDHSRSPEARENSTHRNGRERRLTSSTLRRNNVSVNRSISTRNHQVQTNGVSRSSSSPKGSSTIPSSSIRGPSRRIRQLMLKRKSQQRFSLRRRRKEEDSDDEEEDEARNTVSSPLSSPSSKKDDNGKGDHHNNTTSTTNNNNNNRAVKRRSALWVLNCEAESFLFGETAAEKHEVELPPLAPPSPPPPKKRRWRVNELGALLEKSPGILESKLRKSSSSESGTDTPRDRSPPRKRLKPDAQQQNTSRRVKNEKVKSDKKTSEMCSSKAVKSRGNQPKEEPESQPEKIEEVLSPKPELLSPIPFLYSPDSVDYEAKTVQFRQMLSGLDFGYSFEKPPKNEGWYCAFERTSDAVVPYSSFQSPFSTQIPLPYEMDKPLRRSRNKPVRNSRKSPRCHASTLAILSSVKPTRSTRSSVTLDNSPSASVNNLPSESNLSALLIAPSTSTPLTPSTSSSLPLPSPSPPQPTTSRLLSPPKYIPSSRRRHLSSSPRPNQTQNDCTKEELGAAQYLWDSIQFLSDPYVVTVLSGDDPDVVQHQDHHSENTKSTTKGLSRNHRCNNNNYVNCSVKHMMKNVESSERKASLRSGGDSTSSSNSVNSPNNLTNSRLVSVPKSSPRNHQSHHGTNHVGGGCNKVSSPPSSPKANDRVPTVNGVTRRFTSRSPPLLSPPSSKQTGCHHHHSNNAASKLSPKNSKGTTNTNSAKQSAKSTKGFGSTEGDTNNVTSNGNNGLISNDKASKKSPIIRVSDIYTTTSKTKLNNWDEESLFIGDGLPPLPSWPV